MKRVRRPSKGQGGNGRKSGCEEEEIRLNVTAESAHGPGLPDAPAEHGHAKRRPKSSVEGKELRLHSRRQQQSQQRLTEKDKNL